MNKYKTITLTAEQIEILKPMMNQVETDPMHMSILGQVLWLGYDLGPHIKLVLLDREISDLVSDIGHSEDRKSRQVACLKYLIETLEKKE